MSRAISAGLQVAVRAGVQVPAAVVTLTDAVDHIVIGPPPVGGAGNAGRSDVLQLPNGTWLRAYVDQPALGVAANVYTTLATALLTSHGWNAYALRSAGAEGQAGVALSYNAGTVRLFYQRLADHAICYQESADGISWGGELVACAQGGHVWALASAGQGDLFVAVDDVGGDDRYQDLAFYHLSGGVWSLVSTHVLVLQVRGLSVVYNAGYKLVAGMQVAQSGGLGIYTWLFDGVATWVGPTAIHPLDDAGLGLSLPYPHLTLFVSLYQLVVPIYDDGSVTGTVAERFGLWVSRDFVHWKNVWYHPGPFSGGSWVAPGPLVGGVPQGVVVGDASSVYPSAAAAAAAPPVVVDVSADVLRVVVREVVSGAASGELVLSNEVGQYASQAALVPNARIDLSLGYGSEVVQTHRLYVDEIRFAVAGEERDVTLVLSNGTKRLEREVEVEKVYTAQTVGYLVAAVCVGGGLTLGTVPGTAQFAQVVDMFVVVIGEAWVHALDRLARLYGFDWFVDEALVLQVLEPAAADGSVWTYGSEGMSYGVWTVERANHCTVTGAAPKGASAPVFAEAWDYADVQAVGEERYRHVVDRLLMTSGACQIRAGLELRYAQRSGGGGELVVPVDPARQVLDVVTVADVGLPGGGSVVRVNALVWEVDFSTGVFELRVGVEAR